MRAKRITITDDHATNSFTDATCSHAIDPSGDVIFTLNRPKDTLSVSIFAIAKDTDDVNNNGSPDEGNGVSHLASGKEDDASSETQSNPVTFLVSSRHLMLASPMLKAALTGPWKESSIEDGKQRIDSEDFNADAMLVVFNIIHGHWPSVPRDVDLELLCNIALIVDYYQLQATFDFIAPLWIERLRSTDPIPTVYGRDAVLWMFIAWVFDDNDVFEETTSTALQTSRMGVEIEGLPIPQSVSDICMPVWFEQQPVCKEEHVVGNSYYSSAHSKITQQQKQINTQIIGFCGGQVEALVDGKKGCNPACRTMELGAITQAACGLLKLPENAANLSGPVKYGTHAIGDLLRRFESTKIPDWCDTPANNDYSGRVDSHTCEDQEECFPELLKDIVAKARLEAERNAERDVKEIWDQSHGGLGQ
ncbi:hypothetical protein OQA88_198 [Cercophora sp. LCS_1]